MEVDQALRGRQPEGTAPPKPREPNSYPKQTSPKQSPRALWDTAAVSPNSVEEVRPFPASPTAQADGPGAGGSGRALVAASFPVPGLLHTTRGGPFHTGWRQPHKAAGAGEAVALGAEARRSHGGPGAARAGAGARRRGWARGARGAHPQVSARSRAPSAPLSGLPAWGVRARLLHPAPGARGRMKATDKQRLLDGRPGAR